MRAKANRQNQELNLTWKYTLKTDTWSIKLVQDAIRGWL